MKQVQRGFTLIELVMVIVILGVLAAVAIPKFVDLKGDARLAAAQGVAGALSSASAINYASRSIGSVAALAATVPVTLCSSVVSAMQGGIPADYTASATAVPAGTSLSTCTITTTSLPVIVTNFTAIGIL